MADQATVEVKSGWFSKVNWTQVVGLVASGAAIIGLPVDAATLLTIVAGIQAIVSVVTIVIKTFFTKSVATQSLK